MTQAHQRPGPTPSPGPPFLPASAVNGLSVDPVTGAIVLGQNIGQAGDPAQLLSDREIPTMGHILKLLGTGPLIVTQNNRANTGELLQVDNGVVFENGFGGVIALPVGNSQPTMQATANSAMIRGNNASITVGQQDIVFNLSGVGNADFLAFGGVLNMRLAQNGHLLIGSAVDNGLKLQVNGGISQNQAAFLIHAVTALTNGAAASLGTLTNAPAAGDPTKWIPIDDAGVTRFIPAW